MEHTTPKDRILAYLNSIYPRGATIADIQQAPGLGPELPVAELIDELMVAGHNIRCEGEGTERVFQFGK